ncbi:MAG: hypothetical protein ACKN82_01065 [Pirellula sp.]
MSNEPKPVSRSAQKVLTEEFFLSRSKILDLAATIDRLDRAEGSVDELQQRQLLQHGIEILLDNEPDKAKRVQLLMSRPYDPDWRKNYGLH